MIRRIRSIEENEWVLYKGIRLRSLRDSPDLFSVTYEQAALSTDSEWQGKLRPNSKTAFTLPLVGIVDGVTSGIAWGVIHSKDDAHTNVYQMWVSPESRGQGLGTALLQEIFSWSIGKGRSFIGLGVTSSNIKAIRFYESIGFRINGNTMPLREGSELSVQEMTLDLTEYRRSPVVG